ncbi:MAG: FKBP-type peptidyl-prolyl cis-trans isomerase [Gemmatimonadetes bacterium]|nr:FKBP-type peptidyl-prolyl cis-trans isomerase [Gemmatimonadota bacterium]
MRRHLVMLAALSTLACGDDVLTDPTNDDFAAELNVDLTAMTRTSSGLYLQDLVTGSGDEATSGALVSVHYEGWLRDGTKFDSSRDRAQPFEFTLGARQVIVGWDEGVAGMRVGGMRKLVIPPALGYGPAGTGPIPGSAWLVFDIELLDVN